MNKDNILKGFTDVVSSEDYFGIDKYTTGLADFISNCRTPMTISIQGAWGTGKTTIMNIIKRELEGAGNDKPAKAICINFNAWQFSQFNMDKDLPGSLLMYLVKSIKPKNFASNEKYKKLLKTAGLIAARVASSVVQKNIGLDGLTFDQLLSDAGEIKDVFLTKSIEDFKAEFSSCINEATKERNLDRVVVFIDDLDRLKPQNAVELLEVLKIFLDCEKCVFVLAIDYDVVIQGVAKKYELDMESDKANIEFCKNFFDKIIQVPFKVPVASYNITEFIRTCFDQLGISYENENELNVYEKLICTSIGTNPRAMKRLFNAFLLLIGMLIETDEPINAEVKQLLFGILCLQHFDEEIYNYIVNNRNVLTGEKLISLFSKEDLQALSDVNLNIEQIHEVQPFMNVMLDLIGRDKKGKIKEENYREFVSILELSSITSTAPSVTSVGSGEIVDDASMLKFDDPDGAKVKEIIALINEVGDNVKAILYNQGSGKGMIYGVVDNGKNSRFVESFSRKKGYRLEYIIKTKKHIDMADVQIKKITSTDGWKTNGKKITITVTDKSPEIISNVKTIMRFAYDSWCE